MTGYMDVNDMLVAGCLSDDPWEGSTIIPDDPQEASPETEPIEKTAEKTSKEELEPLVRWLTTAEVMAPIPSHAWVCESLQIGPGRPCGIIGAPYSGKTLVMQSLVLSYVTGRNAFGFFKCTAPGLVRHVDFEQGAGTLMRYQRLARGMGISESEMGERLQVAVFPRLFLDTTSESEWCKHADGCKLMMLDALRGVMPSVDENSSAIQEYMAKLTSISDKTGCSFILLHHPAKGAMSPGQYQRSDIDSLRGSSGIAATLGSVWLLAGKRDEPKLMRQAKGHPCAVGCLHQDWYVQIQDVRDGSNPFWGLHVGYRSEEEVKAAEDEEADGKDANKCKEKEENKQKHMDELKNDICNYLANTPSRTGRSIYLVVGGRETTFREAISQLAKDSIIVDTSTTKWPAWSLASKPA